MAPLSDYAIAQKFDPAAVDWKFHADALAAEVSRLQAALATLGRYSDGLRSSNWGGLANVIDAALEPA